MKLTRNLLSLGGMGVVCACAVDVEETSVSPVNPAGQAVYQPQLGAPLCSSISNICDTGSLIENRSTAEPNHPNTIDGCEDGDGIGSLDRLKIHTLSGEDFGPDEMIRLEATFSESGWGTDSLTLFHTIDPENPRWEYVHYWGYGSSMFGEPIVVDFPLPNVQGDTHAIRVRFSPHPSFYPCDPWDGDYVDRDDLVFVANPGNPCGNGRIESGEACDDYNRTSGDGCSDTCQIEVCGDGVINNADSEDCDDGNIIDGDGCSSTCFDESIQTGQRPWRENANGRLINGGYGQFAYGYHFTPLVDGDVTAIGGSFEGTKIARLFDRSSGDLLAETTISSSYDWNYSPVPPVAVDAGQAYTVAIYFDGCCRSYRYRIDRLPQTYGDIRIDASTSVYTGSNPDARPTNSNRYNMTQADIEFQPR